LKVSADTRKNSREPLDITNKIKNIIMNLNKEITREERFDFRKCQEYFNGMKEISK